MPGAVNTSSEIQYWGEEKQRVWLEYVHSPPRLKYAFIQERGDVYDSADEKRSFIKCIHWDFQWGA